MSQLIKKIRIYCSKILKSALWSNRQQSRISLSTTKESIYDCSVGFILIELKKAIWLKKTEFESLVSKIGSFAIKKPRLFSVHVKFSVRQRSGIITQQALISFHIAPFGYTTSISLSIVANRSALQNLPNNLVASSSIIFDSDSAVICFRLSPLFIFFFAEDACLFMSLFFLYIAATAIVTICAHLSI